MFYIPAEFFPIIGFFFALIVGGIGTMIMNVFRKKEISVDISNSMPEDAAASKHSVAKHG